LPLHAEIGNVCNLEYYDTLLAVVAIALFLCVILLTPLLAAWPVKRGLRGVKSVTKLLAVYAGLLIFYIYGFMWTAIRREVSSMEDVLRAFYYDFLRLRPEHLEVVKITDCELVTISRNPCPILKLTLILGLDTKFTCRAISETVCRYVLRKLDPRLVFERDYSFIRPYGDGCLERISRHLTPEVS